MSLLAGASGDSRYHVPEFRSVLDRQVAEAVHPDSQEKRVRRTVSLGGSQEHQQGVGGRAPKYKGDKRAQTSFQTLKEGTWRREVRDFRQHPNKLVC